MKTLLILLLSTLSAFAAEPWEKSYSALLKKYAVPSGVRYAAWKANAPDLAALEAITSQIAVSGPADSSRDARLAYHINAYNAWTIRNVLDHYPIKSIKDVGIPFSFFFGKSITVAGKKMSLNELEKGIIIGQFHEPRIHFAINCASRSCPPLLDTAYTAKKLDAQLTASATKFINDNPEAVKITGQTVALSSIFKWYAADFAPSGGAVAFINNFRRDDLTPNQKIAYQSYNWTLNEAR